jgi:hypothetical protein
MYKNIYVFLSFLHCPLTGSFCRIGSWETQINYHPRHRVAPEYYVSIMTGSERTEHEMRVINFCISFL